MYTGAGLVGLGDPCGDADCSNCLGPNCLQVAVDGQLRSNFNTSLFAGACDHAPGGSNPDAAWMSNLEAQCGSLVAQQTAGSLPSSPDDPSADTAAAGFTTAQVKNLQTTLSGALAAAGYNTIAVDGTLGPATCGAINWYQANVNAAGGSSFVPACAGFNPVAPTRKGSAPSTPVGPAVNPFATSQSSMTGWIIGGLLVAAGVAAVVATKKKR